MTLKVSTFNCENLLSRAKLLNYDDNSVARKPLGELATLQGVLDKQTYTDKDKRDIIDLLDTLKEYVDLSELRGKLISKKNGVAYVKPSGRGAWVGGIRLKLEKLPLEAQKNTARVVKAVGADIQCDARFALTEAALIARIAAPLSEERGQRLWRDSGCGENVR